MKKLNDQGIILSRINFAERDKIITVLLRNHGKMRLMAKGARAMKSKLAGGIELFSESSIGFIESRGEIKTMTSSRLNTHFSKIVLSYEKTQTAYRILRTINQVVDDGWGQDYYNVLLVSFKHLNTERDNNLTVDIWFSLKLLHVMGESIELNTGKNGKSLDESDVYSFDYEQKCFYPDSQGEYPKQLIKLLRILINSKEPIVANISEQSLNKASNMLRGIVEETIE